MTTQTVTDAEDTWVDSDHPGRPHGSADWLKLGGATRAVLVALPIQSILGRTVETAPLTFRVGPGHDDQEYTVVRATADWSDADATWSNKPTVGGTAVTASVSPLGDGSAVTIDAASLMQEVADGRTWFGFWITSDAGTEQLLYSADSGDPAWELEIVLSDNPEQPEGLFPDVGAVGAAKITQGWRAADLDGVSGQAHYQIQYSTVDDWADPDHETGWLDGVLPRHDMTAYSYAFTDGVETGWRVQVRDSAGRESKWSDPARTTYDSTLGALVLDAPAATTIGDPSPRVQAHLTGGESITKWRIQVAKEGDRTDLVYDSRLQPGDSSGLLDFEIPFRDPVTGRRVFPDDKPRWLHVEAWGSKTRGTAEGRSDHLEAWVLITADDDLTLDAPSGLTVEQIADGDPRHLWTWSLAEAPNGILLGAGDDVLERLEPGEYDETSGTYSYADDGLLSPWVENDCWVRAVADDGTRSGPSNVVTRTPHVRGRWIITDDPDIGVICLAETGGDSLASVDTTSVAQKLNGGDYTVSYGPPWIRGQFTGAVSTIAAYEQLELLRKRAASLRPRFVWATRSIRARIQDMSPMPDSERFMPNRPIHVASMTISQLED